MTGNRLQRTRRKAGAWCLLLLMLCPGRSLMAHDPRSVSEDTMKAVMVSIITEHTEWPETTSSNSERPITVGFVRSIPFEEEFEEAVADLKKNGVNVEMKQVDTLSEALECQVVYFPEKTFASHRSWLIPIGNEPILTIGESPAFCEEGGILRLTIEKRKINMLLNIEAMSGAGIRIPSAVARQATLYRAEGRSSVP